MIQLIKAVVLDSFKFKETSVICNTYSQEYGLMSILVSGLGRKNIASTGQIYFQPLTIIEYTVNYKEKKGILRASNISLIFSPIGIEPDVGKYAISFFIAEIIIKTCKEKEQDTELFALLHTTTELFKKANYRDIHLFFLIQYIKLLGFSLKDDEFITSNGIAYGYSTSIKNELIRIASLETYVPLSLSKSERLIILKFILQFLTLNTGISKLNSLQVLEDIFS